MTWPHGRQTPDNNLMRFISRRFPNGFAEILDIGSGEGANARELRIRNHYVVTVDKDPRVKADVCIDICNLDHGSNRFDCVLDINCLCHIRTPPIEKIRTWLKPEGFFFAIHPTEDTWTGVGYGKNYTRFASEYELRARLLAFSEVRIWPASYPDFQGHEIKSWVIEAMK